MAYRAFNRPPKIHHGQFWQFQISELHYKHTEKKYDNLDDYNPLGRPMLMGYVIPDFQRPLVWTMAQKVSLIESVWRGNSIGSYTVNLMPSSRAKAETPDCVNILIDGLQRINDLKMYFDDQIEVGGCFWSEVPKREQLEFRHSPFGCYQSSFTTRKGCIDYYNAMNFGGTAHTSDEYVKED